jgi:hypothetical protein
MLPVIGLGASAIISGAVGAGKAIIGGIQALKGKKQMNNLLANRPEYKISQGYQDAYKTYQGLANSSLPGYDIMKGQIDQSGARAMTNLERGAMGSNQYMAGALQSQDKELEAIKNLGLMSAEWRSKQQQNLAGAQNVMGGLQDQQWQQNVNEPWNMRMNMANEKTQAGAQNAFGGLQDMGSSLMQFAGTQYYANALKSMQPQQGGNIANPNQVFSKPLTTRPFDPQANLLNTTQNMFNSWRNK